MVDELTQLRQIGDQMQSTLSRLIAAWNNRRFDGYDARMAVMEGRTAIDDWTHARRQSKVEPSTDPALSLWERIEADYRRVNGKIELVEARTVGGAAIVVYRQRLTVEDPNGRVLVTTRLASDTGFDHILDTEWEKPNG